MPWVVAMMNMIGRRMNSDEEKGFGMIVPVTDVAKKRVIKNSPHTYFLSRRNRGTI